MCSAKYYCPGGLASNSQYGSTVHSHIDNVVALPLVRTEANVRIRLIFEAWFMKHLVERMVRASGQSQGYDGSDVEQMEVDEEGWFERCPVALLEDGTILRQYLRQTLRHHVHAYLRVAEVWHTTHHIGHVHVPTHFLHTGRHVQRSCASVKLCALRSAMTGPRIWSSVAALCKTTLPTGHEVLDTNCAINTSQQATLPAGREVVNLNDHSGQQDNNEEAPLNSHVETGTSEVPADANNSSWAARNPDQPVLMSRAPLNAAQKAQANAQRASRKISAAQCKGTEDALTGAIQWLLAGQNDRIEAIASEHGVTQDKVNKLMGGERYYKKGSQNTQLANALIHAKAQEVNADRPRGAKYSLDEIREIVKADKSMQNLVHEEQQEYTTKLNEHRALQNMKADEIMRKLEQWACMAGRNILIHLDLDERTIAKWRDICINYTNFDIAMKDKLAIDLKGWPEGVPFQSPTSINDLKALLKDYAAELAACRKKGEVIGKPCKKRTDAGVPCKRKGKENAPLRKRVRAAGSSMQAPKSVEYIDTTDEDTIHMFILYLFKKSLAPIDGYGGKILELGGDMALWLPAAHREQVAEDAEALYYPPTLALIASRIRPAIMPSCHV
ncbi:uncharacterized protein F5891DRAFT_977619 [Suillus fuscotomentosus]|uniref:Uncharacterized protein n=1 Tax=Suillus fuscotomentosus TaxID=1912939 RepID=A0AAD4HMU3_9AGAM|nr:uncharacterized protein F5891DRAFT_977619 [Suillus fuscotomentosus]KAG1903495.1 hypothetical protein F5891DRAFT_977619 [Suillus fuscotomentosus]